MTADSKIIRLDDAMAEIRTGMKRTCTAARRQGYKESMEILAKLPAVPQHIPDVSPVIISPGLGRSHWFYINGYRFCYNCGAEDSRRKTPRFCSNCGFIMDELMDLEIE